jgi:hypothetical protein
MRTQRADILVYVLWELVLPDIMQDHVRMLARFQKKTLNLAEKLRRKAAFDLSGKYHNTLDQNVILHSLTTYFLIQRLLQFAEDEASQLILDVKLNSIKIASFTVTKKEYTIEVDGIKSNLLSCNCPDYESRKIICKHLFLANRMLNLALHNVGYPSSSPTIMSEVAAEAAASNFSTSANVIVEDQRRINLEANQR